MFAQGMMPTLAALFLERLLYRSLVIPYWPDLHACVLPSLALTVLFIVT
jgi:hypothetical protein